MKRSAIVIFFTALIVRLGYLWQIHASALFTTLMGDARGYDAWAQQIAAGDWIGKDVFYQAPLYPYLLGALYAVGGRHLLAVRIVQAVLGSTACVLLARAGARFFSEGVGTISGLMLALYAPAVFFDGLLQKSVLDVFLICLLLWILSGLIVGDHRSAESPSLSHYLYLGLTLGALSLTRENALVFVVVILAWIVFASDATIRPSRATSQRRWQRAAMFVIGLAVVLSPVAVRNRVVGGEFHLTTAQFGPNFYMGNNPHTDGTATSLRSGRGSPEYERQDATDLAESATGRHLTPAEVSSYWTGQALAFIRSQPTAWMRLMVRKSALVWNATEWLDTESQDSYAESSSILRVGAFVGHFGVLVPLAFFGVCLTWSDRRRLWVLWAMTASYAASVAMFYIYARYRFPLVPFLVLFAAAGLAEAPSFFRGGTASGRSAIIVATTVAIAVFANWRMLPQDLMRAITENNLGAALLDDGRVEEAAQHYEKALAIQPDYGPAHNNMGVALAARGRLGDAIAAYQRAAALDPTYPDPEFNVGNALLRQDRSADAIPHFRRALELAPGSADVYTNLGIALSDAGRAAEAIDAFGKALRLDPNAAKTHRNLGNALAATGKPKEALDELRRAVAIDPTDGAAHYDLASLLLDAQEFNEAIIEFRAAIERLPNSAEARNNLGIALGSTGKLDEAVGQFETALRLRPDFAEAQRNLTFARDALRRQTRR